MSTAAPITIGVTGQLLLDAQERQQVAHQAREELHKLRPELLRAGEVQLLSGVAPGADLVLTDTLLSSLLEMGVNAHLTAIVVDSPHDLILRWQQRAEQLGQLIPPESVERVRGVMQQHLDRAQRQLRVISSAGEPDSGFAQLASLLAESSSILFAVLRPEHSGGLVGTRQTVAWWEQPATIPDRLRWRLSSTTPGLRRLIRIDPSPGTVSQRTELLEELDHIRARMQAGNPLAANDIAARLLRKHPDHWRLRYLYLLSLAQCGATLRALRFWGELSPNLPQDEDWLALPGRLHKDLAFAGLDVQNNLLQAAAHYRAAHAATGGYFSAINAASLLKLANHSGAETLAREVLAATSDPAPSDATAAFYHHASHAEACAVLGDVSGCCEALGKANPLLRHDLGTRARTRSQIGRVLQAQGLATSTLQALALPRVYVLHLPAEQAYSPQAQTPTGAFRQQLEASPLYAWNETDVLTADAPLEQLRSVGMRLFLQLPEGMDPQGLGEQIEGWSQLRGFQPQEAAWQQALARRHLRGLAAIHAHQLGVECIGLERDNDGRWQVCDAPIPAVPTAPPQRQMVGLIFTDLVGFSSYSDAAVATYWQEVVPALARAIAPWKDRILLQQTWGDAIHLVTQDVLSAAELTQVMLRTVRALRRRIRFGEQRLEMRIGAHFAPSWYGQDAIQSVPTWFGSQLSLTARVEPVTPPGTTFVTEAFAAELALTDSTRFRLEYAGEIALAKRYGHYRLYSLHPNTRPDGPASAP